MILSPLALTVVPGTLLGQREHKTPQAAEKANDLSCYVCDTMDVGPSCANLVNNSLYIQKCFDDRRTCMVKNFSYHTISENMTTRKNLWSLQRNCTNKCEPGCIVIGERTKLYACTACCEKSLCNVGNTGACWGIIHPAAPLVLAALALALAAFDS
ncbi:hypothetical protein C0J52_04933 [Blattella germanica]|nr:hypothetical protein C0J52_04933 [Blattella germanica]